MPALIIVTDPSQSLLKQISQFFDDYKLVTLTAKEKTEYYSEVRKAISAVYETDGTIFLIANGNTAFNIILSAKLILASNQFIVAEWIGERFRTLIVP